MQKILKWLLMFSSMVQIRLSEEDWSDRESIYLGRIWASQQGTKAAGGAVPWKQL